MVGGEEARKGRDLSIRDLMNPALIWANNFGREGIEPQEFRHVLATAGEVSSRGNQIEVDIPNDDCRVANLSRQVFTSVFVRKGRREVDTAD